MWGRRSRTVGATALASRGDFDAIRAASPAAIPETISAAIPPVPDGRVDTSVPADAMERVAALGGLIDRRLHGLMTPDEYAAAKARMFDCAPPRP